MPSHPSHRLDSVDALRGFAVLWMAVFHFCYDLNHFGWIQQNFLTDSVWTLQRTAIVSVFLFCVGLGQSIAVTQGQSWSRFWKRWGQVALCAVGVTLGSLWMFPASYIYFGVLHGIAVMLIIARLTAGWGRWLWVLGGVAIALKFIAGYAHGISGSIDFLNYRWFNWLGLIGYKPRTEDYVPLVPWLGVVWWGMAAGRWMQLHRPGWLMMKAAPTALVVLGRWSLSFYMLHQPVLLGAMALLAAF